MVQKAKDTSEFILEKVSPVFNKKGYVGTSLSDLTKVTQLTKGALYFNFTNKEELAIKSFHYNVSKILKSLNAKMDKEDNAVYKLFALTEFYRNYYDNQINKGGCPILNAGVDSKYLSPLLLKEAKEVINKLIKIISVLIKNGIRNNHIKADIDADVYAKNFYSMIEGGIFMANTLEDKEYLARILDHIDEIIFYKMKV